MIISNDSKSHFSIFAHVTDFLLRINEHIICELAPLNKIDAAGDSLGVSFKILDINSKVDVLNTIIYQFNDSQVPLSIISN